MEATPVANGPEKGFMHGKILVMSEDTHRAWKAAQLRSLRFNAIGFLFFAFSFVNSITRFALAPWWACFAALLAGIALNVTGWTMLFRAKKRYIA